MIDRGNAFTSQQAEEIGSTRRTTATEPSRSRVHVVPNRSIYETNAGTSKRFSIVKDAFKNSIRDLGTEAGDAVVSKYDDLESNMRLALQEEPQHTSLLPGETRGASNMKSILDTARYVGQSTASLATVFTNVVQQTDMNPEKCVEAETSFDASMSVSMNDMTQWLTPVARLDQEKSTMRISVSNPLSPEMIRQTEALQGDTASEEASVSTTRTEATLAQSVAESISNLKSWLSRIASLEEEKVKPDRTSAQ